MKVDYVTKDIHSTFSAVSHERRRCGGLGKSNSKICVLARKEQYVSDCGLRS
ncbi:hypothetical protein SERLA73DRAFT_189652 [Serpula lacrymans var. lacrymans S7.3]|uniref:Uncharacterized protein n=2 Tax=Serpula lacrymans var. lacrymans TaxID=341189 RepID=F8QEB4_SERL3|nr:uncharacterized protein SERLADRAFT_480536 [Serpula lacrymans var. lacrymans S7.9]EGN93489.1 hypothetical protein SERLA73DRAFT_189652 [Serpula lacrymans var. lacrymans S7.3]EGO18867.1 hypothetical protein SERLADRAFT_480536 [Serpula lacrymans var. lacrymans S7.9]